MPSPSPFVLPLLVAGLAAQTLQPPFDATYTVVDLGAPPGVPTPYGGITFEPGDADHVYLCGGAGSAAGAVYRLPLQRDSNTNITGFAGPGVRVASAPSNDGGLQFGPGGVLFYTRYRANELGMIKPGSSATDKVVALTPLGMPASVGALCFVPAGYPNTGRLKLASYNTSQFATATLQPDGNGTFDVVGLTVGTTTQSRPEGIFYVPPDSPHFVNFTSMLVCEYGAQRVTAYGIDGNGDPLPGTQRPFLTGILAPEGATNDPLSGDFLFSTYGGNNRVLSVRGFGVPCGQIGRYGNGLRGSGQLEPTLDSLGCFARRQTVQFRVAHALGAAPGVLVAGLQPLTLQLFGGTVLVTPFSVLPFVLGGASGVPGDGSGSLPIPIPDDTHLLNTDFFFQAMVADPGAVQSVAFTAGVSLRVR